MRLAYPYPTALRFAASLAILRIAATVSALVVGTLSLTLDRGLLLPALVLIGLSVTLTLIGFAQAFSLKCVVCRCSLFLPKSCAKSPEAKALLGSRLLEMSLDILLGTSFRCQYCGERCGCKKSSPKPRHAPHGARLSEGHPSLGPAASGAALVLGRNPASNLPDHLPLATQVPPFNLMSPPSSPRTSPAPRAPYPAPPAQQFSPFLLPQASPFLSPHIPQLPGTREDVAIPRFLCLNTSLPRPRL